GDWTITYTVCTSNCNYYVQYVYKFTSTDTAGNSDDARLTISYDWESPTVISITRDDPNPTNAAQVYMQVDFSESVSGVTTANFSIDATGGQTSASVDSVGLIGGVSWWVLVNTVDDATGTLSIDLDSSMASITDDAGNEIAVAYTAGQAYDVDRLDPTVTGVSVSDPVISDADAGGTFTVTVDFSEAMNTGIDPAIAFAPAIGTTLAFASDSWPDSDTYTATYNVSDANVDHDSVTIDVTGAQDTIGHGQADYTPVHEFEIDTVNPTVVDVVVGTNPVWDGDLIQEVTVMFDEVMLDDGTADPVVAFGVGTWSSNGDGSYNVADTVWTETFTMTDNNEDIPAGVTVDVSGAKDAAGNDQQDYSPQAEFPVDTLNPTVTVNVVD
ncbi:hypothetical protein KAR02_07440, partial [Candidatus Bipolaricaulota bacterium]|nr:hypothetical protein [Candidatus Bipolaricaulota bacterium]